MRTLQQKYPLAGLNILGCDQLSKSQTSFFAHSRIGQNGNPESKIGDFCRQLESWEYGSLDLAFLKLCYVDITRETDADRLFLTYEKNMNSLQEKFPQTGIIHFTVPLKAGDNFPKSFFRKISGSPGTGLLDNIRRNEFNEKIRGRYGAGGTLFDLAEAEATGPDGTKAVFQYGGKNYACLARDYTTDGGHLNESGSEKIGQNLLIYLAGKAA